MRRWAAEQREVILIVAYVLAVTLTTAISGALGPRASVIDSLPGIGLVIVIRGELHELWRGSLLPRMAVLIFYGSLGSLAANLSHPRVAVASFVAFVAANVVATLLYDRSKKASVVGFAVVDSLVFPPIAFGVFAWWVVGGQVGAKILGAAIWSKIFALF